MQESEQGEESIPTEETEHETDEMSTWARQPSRGDTE